jgi:hypothetical protein
MYTTVIVTTYVDLCPTGLTTLTKQQTQTHFSGYESPHIPMVTTTKTQCDAIACTAHTLTVPYSYVAPTTTASMKGNVGSLGAPRATATEVKFSTVMVLPVFTDAPGAKNATAAAPTMAAPTNVKVAPMPNQPYMAGASGMSGSLSWGVALVAGLWVVLFL